MYNEDNNSSNNGNKGKWSERLYKMKINRLKSKNNDEVEVEDRTTIKDFGRNILKVFLVIPSVVYTNVVDSRNKSNNKKNNNKSVEISNELKNDKSSNLTNEIDYTEELKVDEKLNDVLKKYTSGNRNNSFKVSRIRDIDVSLLIKQRELFLKNNDLINNEDAKNIVDNIDIELRKVELQKEIINLIKKRLVKNINEFEVLQSELYVLNELDGDDIYLEECKEDIKEIKKLLSKIKSLKEKYDYLKDNVDFEYMLEYGDDFLVDKILELKDICSRGDIEQTINDYKILDEYKFLYLKIDKLQEDTNKVEEYKSKKVEELKQRDIDFEQLKNSLYDVDREKDRYDDFVKRQEMLLRELDDKVRRIDSYEKVTYRLKGFNQLLGNSFKYLGLLLVNPLKGLVPGIATQTLVTKNMIHNLYNNLEWEENRKMVYDAIDYSSSIGVAINNLDDMSSIVDSTLSDIIALKSKYMKEFSQYEESFSSYKDAIKKLNKIENAVLGSKIKIENMKSRMKDKERQNDNKLKMVKKLNDENK